MHAIVDQLRNYFRAVNAWALLFTSLVTTILIILNYTYGIESRIISFSSTLLKFTGFFLLFAFTFCAAWLIQTIFSKENIFSTPFFYLLLISSPIIFAGKVTFDWFAATITRPITIITPRVMSVPTFSMPSLVKPPRAEISSCLKQL